MERLTKRYIIQSLDNLNLSKPIRYERYYINDHLRIQKREDAYQKEILDDNNVQLFHSADVKVSQKDELTPISVAAPENPVYNSIKPAFDTVVNNNTVDAFEISDKKALDLSNSVSEKKEKKGFPSPESLFSSSN